MLKHKLLFPVFAVLGIAALLYALRSGTWGFFIATIGVALAVTAWGSFDIRLGYFTTAKFRKNNPPQKVIALTFDDGPSSHTVKILDLLARYQAKATFFCIGKQIEQYPTIFKRIIEEGHSIGNHTRTHPHRFGFLNTAQVIAEIENCDTIIAQFLGHTPALFRPPFGVTNPSVAKAVEGLNKQLIGWSNRSLDTVITNADKIYERVKSRLRSGDIILLHDTSQRSVYALSKLLADMKAEGYACVSVDDLLNLPLYED
jgi:peptidoglycan-N-acetylglucosamine deacetylase